LDVTKVPVPGEGALLDVLAAVVDPRKRRGVRHPVGYVIAAATCAMLCGASSLVTIAEWAARQPARRLRQLGAKRERAPSEPTLRRVLGALDAAAFEQAVGAWFGALVTLAGEGLALDGKSLRGAASAEGRAPHLVSALVHRVGIVLGQGRVPDKQNELGAVEPLLAPLALEGAVVSGDALFTPRAVASYVVEQKSADYIFTVKDNPPTLRADIEALQPASCRGRRRYPRARRAPCRQPPRRGDGPGPAYPVRDHARLHPPGPPPREQGGGDVNLCACDESHAPPSLLARKGERGEGVSRAIGREPDRHGPGSRSPR